MKRLEELKQIWNEVCVNGEFMEVEDRGERIAIRINGCGELEVEKKKMEDAIRVLEAFIMTARKWKIEAWYYEIWADTYERKLKEARERRGTCKN